jgi:hypothetical protein
VIQSDAAFDFEAVHCLVLYFYQGRDLVLYYQQHVVSGHRMTAEEIQIISWAFPEGLNGYIGLDLRIAIPSLTMLCCI